MSACSSVDDLKTQRWATGKDAVDAIKDIAFRKESVFTLPPEAERLDPRNKSGPADWHVTDAQLQHQNCTSSAGPSHKQLVSHPVVRAAIAATPSISTRSLATQLRHQSGVAASQHVVYRAKETIKLKLFADEPTTVRQLPSFLSELEHLNTGIVTDFECYETGRFRRAVIVLNPQWFVHGQGVFGIDAAHMKHRKYNGVQIVLVGRDGNLSNQIAVVALAPVEDHDNYAWFFSKVMNHGFPLSTCPVLSDRNLGLMAAANELGVLNIFCVRHIIGNMRADMKVRLSVSQETFVWQANAATTQTEFEKAMDKLKQVNTEAEQYLRDIPVLKWALHPHYDTTPLFGWRTTNFVESEQAKSLRLKPRMMLPFEYFKAYATILMGQRHARWKLCATWTEAGRMVTPRAEKKVQVQLKQAAEYSVVFSTDVVAFVAHLKSPLSHRRVNIGVKECSCDTWKQQKIPCRHLLAAMTASGTTDLAFSLVGACYTVDSYLLGMGTMEIPEERALTPNERILPAPFIRQAGRPKKRRIRSRGETSGSGSARK